ncbi:uncharacterized protein LOC125177768 [Hyalella azteca]|uniref:Uncharacterized protein LOC125177768 n=1 Tax=Hyalella azteca TaxID=294128 RepID=A0A979FGP4_HYAAZ|nr:uncharacterized protein LOC125177768 [Hyalella azteca]
MVAVHFHRQELHRTIALFVSSRLSPLTGPGHCSFRLALPCEQRLEYFSCLVVDSELLFKGPESVSLIFCAQIIVLLVSTSSCIMMTPLFAVDQSAQQAKKLAKTSSKHHFVRNKSLDETMTVPRDSLEVSKFPSAVASLSDLSSAKQSKNLVEAEAPPNSGTKPKVKNTPDFSGSSSDDAVFHPQKGRVKFKSKTAELDGNKSVSLRTLSQSSSSELETSVIDTRFGRPLGHQRGKHFQNNSNYSSQIRSSSSSLSGSSSKMRISRAAKDSQQRSKSAKAATLKASSHSRPITSAVHTLNDQILAEKNDTILNRPQNTDVIKLDKTYSTVENAAFLKKVEEVLSEIVEQKKRKILSSQRDYSTLRPSRGSSSKERKTSPRSCQTWIISKRFDESDHKQSFSHIITSHGNGRLRTRSKSSDLLVTHERCFTKLEPYKPRILRKDSGCQLMEKKEMSIRKNLFADKKVVGQNQNKYCGTLLADTPQTDEQKSSTIEENLTNTTNNTEAEDTCYESENEISECALDVNMNASSPLKTNLGDHAEASVDSAYTGSRGPTPDGPKNLKLKSLQHKLHHREKHMQHQKKQGDVKRKVTVDQQEVENIIKIEDEDISEKIKHEIMQEIKEVGIYSEYAITTLLDLYRRKYMHVSRKQFDVIAIYIKNKFGVGQEDTEDSKSNHPEPSVGSGYKKGNVKFIEDTSQVGGSRLEKKCNEVKDLEENYLILPAEALHLREVLDKTKDSREGVRWLSHDEILEAKWASQILTECGIRDQSTKILENAKTWEEVVQALGFTSPFFNTIECGHEDDQECETQCVPNVLYLPPLDSLQCNDTSNTKRTTVSPENYDNKTDQSLLYSSEPACHPKSDLLETNEDKTQESPEARDDIQARLPNHSDRTDFSNRLSPVTLTAALDSECLAVKKLENNDTASHLQDNTTHFKKGNALSELPVGIDTANEISDKKQDDEISSQKEVKKFSDNGSILFAESNPRDYHRTSNGHLSNHELNPAAEALDSDDDFFESPFNSNKGKAASNTLHFINNSLKSDDSENHTLSLLSWNSYQTGNSIPDKNTSGHFSYNAAFASEEVRLANSTASPEKDPQRESLEPLSLKPSPVMPAIVSDNLLPASYDELCGYSTVVGHQQAASLETSDVEKSCDRLTRKSQTVSGVTTDQTPNLPHTAQASFCNSLYDCQEDSGTVSGLQNQGISCQTPEEENHSAEADDREDVDPGRLNGNDMPHRKLCLLGQDLCGPNTADIRASLSPTQPSLQGKIAALAAAYSSKTEEVPDWLVVADDVCKQFDISL